MHNKNPILVFCGLLGTGKTTISLYIASKLSNYTRFNSDDARRILGFKTFDRKNTPAVNEYMYSRAHEILKEGKGVIFDSAYKLQDAREKLYSIARENNVPLIIIECVCSPEVAIERLTKRPPRDKIYGPTNKAEDYHEYVSLWEHISNDFKSPDMGLISYIKLNTENYEIDIKKLGKKGKKEAETAIQDIKIIIKDFHTQP